MIPERAPAPQQAGPARSRLRRLVPPAYRPALEHPALRGLLPGMTVSSLGDGMCPVAITWLALSLAAPGQRGLLVGVSLAAFTLPGVLAGATAGRFLGRRDGRLLLLLDSSLRAVALGAVPVLSLAGLLTPAACVASLAVSSLLHAWGRAGRDTLVAELLPDGQRLAANALVASMDSMSLIVGPASAGLLIAAVSPADVIGLDAASYAVLALSLARSRRRWPARPRALPAAGERPAGGYRTLLASPALVGLLALSFTFNLLYGPVEVALPIHVVTDLKGGPAVLGLFWTLFGIGAISGSLAAGAARRLPPWPAAIGAVAVWGAVLLLLGLDTQLVPELAAFGLGGLVYGPYSAVTRSLLQRNSPPRQLAAIAAANSSVLIIAQPAGTALGGPLVTAAGARGTILISAAATIATACAASALLAARTRHHRPPAGPAGRQDGSSAGPTSPTSHGSADVPG
ncbi:MAG: MFS transporter [Trebonia sp.]